MNSGLHKEAAQDAAFERFMHDVWRKDVSPLLRGPNAELRGRTARLGGKLAASTGLLVDKALQLRGRPFARFMTVLGSSLGAILPDVWEWKWLSGPAGQASRGVVEEQVARRAAVLAEADALALFGLPPSASVEELKGAWRAILQRWHPDKARDPAQREEFHIRFLAYSAAHRRLCDAYEAGRLPLPA